MPWIATQAAEETRRWWQEPSGAVELEVNAAQAQAVTLATEQVRNVDGAVTQSQTTSLAIVVSRTRTVTQAQQAELLPAGNVYSATVSATQAQVARRSHTVQIRRQIGQGQAATFTYLLILRRALYIDVEERLKKPKLRLIKRVELTRRVSQAQAVSIELGGRLFGVTVAATQAQAASISTPIALERGVIQEQTAIVAAPRTLQRTVDAVQEQAVALLTTGQVALIDVSATQTQTATFETELGRGLVAPQAQQLEVVQDATLVRTVGTAQQCSVLVQHILSGGLEPGQSFVAAPVRDTHFRSLARGARFGARSRRATFTAERV